MCVLVAVRLFWGSGGRGPAGAILAALMLLAFALPVRAEAPPTVIVVDSSGSMSAALEGQPRLDAARGVLIALLEAWPAQAPLALMAYGHRRSGDCADIEVLAPLGLPEAKALTARLAGLRARGKTPLSASLEQAAGLLAAAGAGGSIILLTDGVETCDADPCAVAAALRAAEARLTIHVVGFAIEPAEEAQLACIAEAGGGLYRTAGGAEALLAAMGEAASAAMEPEPAPGPPPSPAPEPEPPRSLQVAFAAVIEAEGPLVDWPVAWRIVGETGPEPFVYEGESRALSLELPPGRYHVEARASNAVGRATVEVTEAARVEVTLPAGRLSAKVVPYRGAVPLDEAAGPRWSLQPLDGQPLVAAPQTAQPTLLLAAGRYRLLVEQDSRRAEAEVTIRAGQPTEATLSFRLGELTLFAAVSEEAKPLSDWRGMAWRALAPGGTLAAEMRNLATASFLLPAGRYRFELSLAGATVARELEVMEAERRSERFVVATGSRTFSAALAPGLEPLSDWRQTVWSVTAIDVVGLSPGSMPLDGQPVLNPTLALLPGRWAVSVVSGHATAGREILVAPESEETVRLDLEAALLTIVAEPAAGAPPAANVVFEVVPLGHDGTAGPTISLGGAPGSYSSILPAGRWRILTLDEQGRRAEAELDLAGGEERTVTLQLK